MPIYRNKNTGKLIEVLKGTKLPRTFEKVHEEAEQATIPAKKRIKRGRIVKKVQENVDLCKQEGESDGE